MPITPEIEYQLALVAADDLNDLIIAGAKDQDILIACDAFYANHGQAIIKALLKAAQPELSERAVLFRAVDRMGWPEIDAFYKELHEGQAINEDAGGYFIRCIKRLFGIVPRVRIETYKSAMKAMIEKQGEQCKS